EVLVNDPQITRSHRPEAHPIERADATTIADFILEELICRHGCPKELLSD
ncbi:15621_t:CDS:2, partial [Gigaspora rosea]